MRTQDHIEVPAAAPAPADAFPGWVQPVSITVVLSLAVVALWKIVLKVIDDARASNKALVDAQTAGLEAQTKGMAELRDTVKAMDTANQLGLANVTAAVTHAVSRLDRHETKLDEHGSSLHALDRRLTVVEAGGTVIPAPASSPRTP